MTDQTFSYDGLYAEQLAYNERVILARLDDLKNPMLAPYHEGFRDQINRLDAYSDNLCDHLGITRPRYNP